MNMWKSFGVIFTVVICFGGLVANNYVSPDMAMWCGGGLIATAAVGWLCDASFLKTLLTAGLAAVGMFALARKSSNPDEFVQVLVSLFTLTVLLCTLVWMVVGPFRRDK
jgi:hypothetical protein